MGYRLNFLSHFLSFEGKLLPPISCLHSYKFSPRSLLHSHFHQRTRILYKSPFRAYLIQREAITWDRFQSHSISVRGPGWLLAERTEVLVFSPSQLPPRLVNETAKELAAHAAQGHGDFALCWGQWGQCLLAVALTSKCRWIHLEGADLVGHCHAVGTKINWKRKKEYRAVLFLKLSVRTWT